MSRLAVRQKNAGSPINQFCMDEWENAHDLLP